MASRTGFRWKTGTMVNLLVIIAIASAVLIAYLFWTIRYPKTEAQSRSDCQRQLRHLGLGIVIYTRDHEGRMPVDLFELVLAGRAGPYELVCPRCWRAARRSGLLSLGHGQFVSSFRLLVPKEKFEAIPNGTVVLDEAEKNHPESVVDGVRYPAGRHVLVKKDGDLVVEFLLNK